MDSYIKSKRPLIASFVGDLMLTSRIDAVAGKMGYGTEFIGHKSEIGSTSELDQENFPAEPVFGSEASLMRKITAWQPALLIFDLSNKDIPWSDWIRVLKASPASRHIPVLCFGPHVQGDILKMAKHLSADIVVPKSRFMSTLHHLIDKYALKWDHQAIDASCHLTLSDPAMEGLKLFNRREYLLCHERLEEAWKEEQSIGRNLYKAILQVAVAYMQIERGNYRGAVKMFLRSRQWFHPLPAKCRSVDVATLRADAESAYQVLLANGPAAIDDFDRSMFRPIIFRE